MPTVPWLSGARPVEGYRAPMGLPLAVGRGCRVLGTQLKLMGHQGLRKDVEEDRKIDKERDD